MYMILLLNLHFKLVLVCLDEGSNTVMRCRGHSACDGKANVTVGLAFGSGLDGISSA